MKYRSFTGGSDYQSFHAIGVPVSGLFTGSAAVQDPCYHRPCDGTSNINWEALTLNAKAAGRAAAQLALSLEGVPSRNKTKTAGRRPGGLRRLIDDVDEVLTSEEVPEA